MSQSVGEAAYFLVSSLLLLQGSAGLNARNQKTTLLNLILISRLYGTRNYKPTSNGSWHS